MNQKHTRRVGTRTKIRGHLTKSWRLEEPLYIRQFRRLRIGFPASCAAIPSLLSSAYATMASAYATQGILGLLECSKNSSPICPCALLDTHAWTSTCEEIGPPLEGRFLMVLQTLEYETKVLSDKLFDPFSAAKI